MDEILDLLPADALPKVERYLQRMIHRLQKRHDRVDMAEVWLREREQKEHARAKAVEAAVAAVRENGMPYDKALKTMGMPDGLAEFWLSKGLRAAEAEDRRRRNHEIARLAGERVSQAEIARRLKCSPSLVRKVLKGEKQ